MPSAELRSRLTALLTERGPLTGAQVHAELGGEVFTLWRACETDPDLILERVGRRYVRLDRNVDGFARLSPSILREFMTYTVIGRRCDAPAVAEAARRLAARTRIISRNKLRVAQRVVSEAFDPLVASGHADADAFCALVAGDIVYEMAHDVTRRESSTDTVVQGSDLDIIVLTTDEAHSTLAPLLDEALRARKWLYLRSPAHREEVDYIIKPLQRLAEQGNFDSFQSMVACKVFHEAQWLYGSRVVHQRGRALLDAAGVSQRLEALEAEAITNRASRRQFLLDLPEGSLPEPHQVVFYTADEAAEFEH